MKLKLHEDPREWQKFTIVMGLALLVVSGLAFRRQWLPPEVFLGAVYLVGSTFIVCGYRPDWFRGFYRSGMTLSYHLGQFIGKVLLTLFFILLITPLGCLLRLTGKDLLKLKRNPDAVTYWQSAKSSRQFDRMF